MAESVVDALVVTLGLNSKQFNSGLEKATSSLTGFATKIAGLALGFQGLEAGIRYFEGLHHRLADLYFASRNLGVMGTELSRLGELAQMFGGRMEDATGSVEGLQAAVFNLRFKGQMSESLMMLQRFGVAYLNGNGTSRDPEAIARDAAVAIERQARIGNLSAGDRYQLALSFGLQGGLASAAAQGPAGFDAQMARVRKDQSGLTEGTLHGQAGLERDIISRRAQRDVEMSGVLSALLPDLEKMNEMLEDLTAKATPYLTKGIIDLTNAILHPPEIVNDIKEVGKNIGKAAEAISAGAKSIYNWTVLPGTKPGEKPISALDPQGGAYRLGETLRDRFDQWMSQFTGIPVLSIPQPGAIPQFTAPLIIHQAPVTPLAPRPTVPTSGSSKPTAMNGSPATNITFENVTINSRGQDGSALARDFTGSVQRKLLAASSERGLA